MCTTKIIVFAVMLVSINCRHLIKEEYRRPYLIVEDEDSIRLYEIDHASSEEANVFEEHLTPRVRRQAHGQMNTNPDGTANVAAKIPLTHTDSNALSILGTVGGADGKGGYKAAGGGLAWDNVNGHGASLTGQHIPGFGDQATAAAKANLFHNDKHDITANAFATRNFPDKPNFPTFDTYGGNVGYKYNDKIGATLGMAQTDLFKKTDYSAMGNLNLFKDRTSSLDLNAGWSKSVSPYIPSSRWEPSGGISYTKWF